MSFKVMAVAGLVGVILFGGMAWRIDWLEGKRDDLEAEIAEIGVEQEKANAKNRARIAECDALNATNAAEAEKQRKRALAAEARVEELQTTGRVREERIAVELEGLRRLEDQDGTCRTMDDDLARDFVDWLFE